MAGYKQTIIDGNPLAFWTFDGDAYDTHNRNLLSNDLGIIDEMDNQNPGIMHATLTPPWGYRMGMPGLVDLERDGMPACAFGHYGYSGESEPWPKSFVEVPHSNTFALGTSFSIELLFEKSSSTAYNTRNGTYISIYSPVIRKENVIYVSTKTGIGGNRILVWFPDNKTADIQDSHFFDKAVHFVATWTIEETEPRIYTSHAKVYLDGKLKYYATTEFVDEFPNINQNTPWEIGGIIEGPTYHYNDRNTESLILDQISVWDIELQETEIGRHYRKTREYDDMVVNDRASLYWPLSETDNLNNWVANTLVGSLNGDYIGDLNSINRGVPGPDNIPNAVAASFKQGSQFRVVNVSSGYGRAIFNINMDYTFDFWFNTTWSEPGILMSIQEQFYPFDGLLFQINMRNNVYYPGSIQFNESYNVFINNDEEIVENLNDGHWHHVAARHEGEVLSLFVDSGKVGELAGQAYRSIGYQAFLQSMLANPGIKGMEGTIAKVGYYDFALSDQQITNRANYAVIYKIKGVVTLQGVPIQATIRVYDHLSGLLIRELESNNITGEYSCILNNNHKIDVLVFNKQDYSARYRAYGPIIPAECVDLPLEVA